MTPPTFVGTGRPASGVIAVIGDGVDTVPESPDLVGCYPNKRHGAVRHVVYVVYPPVTHSDGNRENSPEADTSMPSSVELELDVIFVDGWLGVVE